MLAREIARDPQVLIAAQPTRGLDVGAIEYVHRRLVEERDAGRAVLLVSLELDEILSLSDRILVIYGAGSSASAPATDEERARLRDDRRRRTRPRRDGDPANDAAGGAGGGGADRHADRGAARARQRAGGIVTPILTAIVAFLVGGLVVLATGHNPLSTYRAIFVGTGLNWLFPSTAAVVDDRRQQPLADAAADDAARPDRPRRRVRVPLRAVQHRRPGPVPVGRVALLVSSWARSAGRRRCSSPSLPRLRRRASGRGSPAS